MLRYFLICFLCINFSNIFAEPNPFGLEIKRSTYKEVKAKYSGKNTGINKYSQGKMYSIDCSQINIEGINSILAIFDIDKKLLAVITQFDKKKYDSLENSLSQKYSLISRKDAFVGDKYVKFKDDNTIIELNAPHMSFSLSLTYIHQDFNKMYSKIAADEEKQKAKVQTNSL